MGEVYFLLAPQSLCVKIGHTVHGAEHRARSLQTGSPEPLRLLLAVEGDQAFEKEIHGWFSADRIRGEWFGLTEALKEFLVKFLPHDGRQFVLSLPTFDRAAWDATEAAR